jgi:hypothetical protein
MAMGHGFVYSPCRLVSITRHIADSSTLQHGSMKTGASLGYGAPFHILSKSTISVETSPGDPFITAHHTHRQAWSKNHLKTICMVIFIQQPPNAYVSSYASEMAIISCWSSALSPFQDVTIQGDAIVPFDPFLPQNRDADLLCGGKTVVESDSLITTEYLATDQDVAYFELALGIRSGTADVPHLFYGEMLQKSRRRDGGVDFSESHCSHNQIPVAQAPGLKRLPQKAHCLGRVEDRKKAFHFPIHSA